MADSGTGELYSPTVRTHMLIIRNLGLVYFLFLYSFIIRLISREINPVALYIYTFILRRGINYQRDHLPIHQLPLYH